MSSIKGQVRTVLNKDGIDHVNVSAYAETEIGRLASPDWRKKFYVPHMGDFVSARSFANWIVSGGNEELRHTTAFYKTSVPTEDFRMLIVFAKYYQLCTMRLHLVAAQDLIELPWVMYKKHFSGVREFDRWESYTPEIKPIVHYILANGAKSHYNWENVNPEVFVCLNYYLQKITGDDFVPFEELNKISKERNQERAKVDKDRQSKARQQQEQTTRDVPETSYFTPVTLEQDSNETVLKLADLPEMAEQPSSASTEESDV